HTAPPAILSIATRRSSDLGADQGLLSELPCPVDALSKSHHAHLAHQVRDLSVSDVRDQQTNGVGPAVDCRDSRHEGPFLSCAQLDRKSTRLNSSHVTSSYS